MELPVECWLRDGEYIERQSDIHFSEMMQGKSKPVSLQYTWMLRGGFGYDI